MMGQQGAHRCEQHGGQGGRNGHLYRHVSGGRVTAEQPAQDGYQNQPAANPKVACQEPGKKTRECVFEPDHVFVRMA